jgi:hypothetical protein
MGTPKTPKSSKDIGKPNTTFISVEEFFEYIRCKSRKFDVAMRTARDEQIQEPNHRREQPIQRSIDQTIQSSKETSKKLQSTYYPYWYANTTGSSGSMVPGWHLGFGPTLGNKPNQVQGQVHDAGSDEPPNQSYIQLED